MPYERALRAILADDPRRLDALRRVAALGLPDCWIGAGFVRAAVWDRLHGRPPASTAADVDVVWFDPTRATVAEDVDHEAALQRLDASFEWSVHNQVRMHARNGDAPYASTMDAMQYWPETATAVAVRLDGNGLEIAAPFGLADLFGLMLRPTPAFAGARLPEFLGRIEAKRWIERWPLLRVAGETVQVIGGSTRQSTSWRK